MVRGQDRFDGERSWANHHNPVRTAINMMVQTNGDNTDTRLLLGLVGRSFNDRYWEWSVAGTRSSCVWERLIWGQEDGTEQG